MIQKKLSKSFHKEKLKKIKVLLLNIEFTKGKIYYAEKYNEF